jgi:hypothetical protein
LRTERSLCLILLWRIEVEVSHKDKVAKKSEVNDPNASSGTKVETPFARILSKYSANWVFEELDLLVFSKSAIPISYQCLSFIILLGLIAPVLTVLICAVGLMYACLTWFKMLYRHWLFRVYAMIRSIPRCECSICMDNSAGQSVVLSCGHQFHVDYLSRWFHQNNSCPLCRQDIVPIPNLPAQPEE